MHRRHFLQGLASGTALAAASAVSQDRVLGANERVRLGLIGCGGRGMAVARLMSQVKNTQFVAVCDVYEPNATKAREWAGSDCKSYGDFRHVLDRPDVDAVLVATPDHWHAIP